jgi:hypothetical protein
MLGTPNGGSWAPMQVLSGDDTFGNALASFGAPLRDRQARQLMAEMPGFLQLQAGLLDPKLALDQERDLGKLARARPEARAGEQLVAPQLAGETTATPAAAYEWGVPPQAVLDQARALRERLDEQRAPCAGQDYADKMLLVVGRAKFTPDGYEWGDEGFVYLNATDGGDGRVPLASALLPGVRTWTLDCEHGSLPESKTAPSTPISSCWRSGDTGKLPRLAATPWPRAAALRCRTRGARAQPARRAAGLRRCRHRTSAGVRRARCGEADAERATQGPAHAAVTVLNGNLAFVRSTLMVGHTRALCSPAPRRSSTSSSAAP